METWEAPSLKMKTENSYQYFRGREAMGRGEGRDSCVRLRGLNRSAWQRGWDDEQALRGQRAERTPEQAAERAEAVEWFKDELAKWMAEEGVKL
jgi:hypothetical protein